MEDAAPVAGHARAIGADILSVTRIAVALFIAGAFTTFLSPGVPAAILFAFIFGVATDVAGAMLVRGSGTPRGRILDSLADKALVYVALVPIALRGFPPIILLLPLAARDAVAVALQVVAARQGIPLAVGALGRLKTASLYLACAALLTLAWLQSASSPVFVDPGDLGTILTYLFPSVIAIVVGTVLAVLTLIGYIGAVRSSEAP